MLQKCKLQYSQEHLSAEKDHMSLRWSVNGPQMPRMQFCVLELWKRILSIWIIPVISLSHFWKQGWVRDFQSRRFIFFAATMLSISACCISGEYLRAFSEHPKSASSGSGAMSKLFSRLSHWNTSHQNLCSWGHNQKRCDYKPSAPLHWKHMKVWKYTFTIVPDLEMSNVMRIC